MHGILRSLLILLHLYGAPSISNAQVLDAQSLDSRTPRLSNSAWHSTPVGHCSICLRGIANISSFVNHPFLKICTMAGRMNSSTPAPPPMAVEMDAGFADPIWWGWVAVPVDGGRNGTGDPPNAVPPPGPRVVPPPNRVVF